MNSNSPNPSGSATNETTPPPRSSNHLRRHGVPYPSHSRGDDSQEPYYFLSEPSISEEGSSSQYTGTPLSPMNGADITMVNSPSNTSLSSLGSPGGAGSVHRKVMMIRKKSYFTKNPIGQFESSLCPMEEVLSSSLEEPETKNDNEEVDREEEEEKKKKSLESENINECIETPSSGTECNDNSEISHKVSMKGESSTGDERVALGSADDTSQFQTLSKKSFEVLHDKTAQTPESARYHTAVESPDNEEDEEDNSISSFEESTSDEEPVASNSLDLSSRHSPDLANSPHYLNEPLAKAEQSQNAEEEGQMTLLGNATVDDEHLQVMDMSSILPESNISPPMDPSLFETPPTRNTAVDDNALPNESVTPKRKTISRHSSLESLGIADLTSQLDVLENNGEMNLGDSKTEEKKDTPRKANIIAEKRNKHRRKRSGDIVAASIYAGSADWAGMELDKIPLPEQRGIDDDMEFFDDVPNFFIDSRSRSKKVLEVTNSGSSSELHLPDKVDDVSNRFSPRLTRSDHEEHRNRNRSFLEEPFLRKNYSFGDRSVSTHDSESNFSWISQRTFQTKETANGKEYARDNMGDSSQTGDTSGLSNIAPFYSADKDGQQPLLDNRFVPVRNERSDSPGPAPPPLERQAGIENEIKHFQSRVHVSSKGDDNSYNSVASAKSVSSIEIEEDVYPTYICPRCSTKQREFFTVASVHKESKGGSGGWMVVIFITYMVGALFLFGWEEGWPKLDCFYFSVMTLTTTGPGDYVPVDDSAKIICSIFIYFGICCIGLSLGYLHAHALDDAARKTAEENKILNCPNCNSISDFASPQRKGRIKSLQTNDEKLSDIVWDNQSVDDSLLSDENDSLAQKPQLDLLMDRRSRTRHQSLLNTSATKNVFDPGYESYANRIRHHTESISKIGPGSHAFQSGTDYDNNGDDASSASSLSIKINASEDDIFHPVSRIRAAKYIFLTMKQAFANSLFVIAVGSVAFYFIEGWTAVDAFYYTCVLFTTIGYGDIVPVTSAGKLFASIYGLVAIVVLLQILSMVSMIPLELRKRKIENTVLHQFGDELDDVTLRELAFGPLMRRLQLCEYSPEGLGQCTREMFSLAMLVRLGRISEQDVRSTFAAFRKLDRDNDGLLTSREIIMSTVERRKRAAMKEEVREIMGNLLPQKRVGNASSTEPFTVSEMTGLLAHSSSDYATIEVENGDGSLPRGYRVEKKDEVV